MLSGLGSCRPSRHDHSFRKSCCRILHHNHCSHRHLGVLALCLVGHLDRRGHRDRRTESPGCYEADLNGWGSHHNSAGETVKADNSTDCAVDQYY